jgi:transposase
MLEEMGELTEDAEEITVEKRRFFVDKHLRHKYRCGRCNSVVKTAPGPLRRTSLETTAPAPDPTERDERVVEERRQRVPVAEQIAERAGEARQDVGSRQPSRGFLASLS